MLLAEARGIFELNASLLLSPLLLRAPRGDGHPVLTLPGFLASDLSMAPMRRYLRELGHDTRAWQLGRNIGGVARLRAALRDRLAEIHAETARKVSIVGWSLGGIYARALALEAPAMVRAVVTLGSPFANDITATNATRLYEALTGESAEADPELRSAIAGDLSVPATSIYSRSDGIVNWQTCRLRPSETAENIEIYLASHVGLGVNPAALWAVADRLAQAEGQFSQFNRDGPFAIAYAPPEHAQSTQCPDKGRRERQKCRKGTCRSADGRESMGDARKLSSLDASFLYLETPEMPMHVGSMAIFRLPDDYKGDFFEDFKAMIASRLHLAPILKSRLEKAPLDIDHPSWVEDDQFDIDRHIFRGSLPQPHDRATLERIVGWMHAKLLNRARPLWEFYVFEGMKDNEVGLYSKMHHACIDGGAGAALTNMIYDVTPVPRQVEPPTARAKAGPEPRDIAANLLDSYQQLWTKPLDAAAAARGIELPRSGKSDIGSILFDNAMFQIESAVKFAGSLPTMLKSASDVIGKISDPKSRDSLASMMSPPTILNKSISSERSFAGASISLSRAKALARQAGGKLNDVVLALSSGVVRRYLLQQGALPAKSMTAAVPISLREEGNTDSNNQVFGMICSIATDVEDPKTRLETIIAQSTKSKEMSHPLRALMPQVSNISMLGAPILVQILALLYSRSSLSDVLPPSANITVSNVPGPRQTLYAAGAELLHIFPVSISTHGIALNITVQSYRDQLDFGFIAGANIIPHVEVLCDMLPAEFAALEAAFAPPADSRAPRTRSRNWKVSSTMIEMPPLQFAQTNGIRMGYYDAGPETDTPPVVLCHGWPELAFSVAPPDQGAGAPAFA